MKLKKKKLQHLGYDWIFACFAIKKTMKCFDFIAIWTKILKKRLYHLCGFVDMWDNYYPQQCNATNSRVLLIDIQYHMKRKKHDAPDKHREITRLSWSNIFMEGR